MNNLFKNPDFVKIRRELRRQRLPGRARRRSHAIAQASLSGRHRVDHRLPGGLHGKYEADQEAEGVGLADLKE